MHLDDEVLAKLPTLQWMRTRIPAIDALSTFVPDSSSDRDSIIDSIGSLSGRQRWFPTEGGHRVIVPFEGQEFNTAQFSIDEAAWDHEHCDACGERLPAMTLHYCTAHGPYIGLCNDCFRRLVRSKLTWWKRFF